MRLFREYVIGIARLHKVIFMWPLERLINSENVNIAVTASNIKFLLLRSKLRIGFSPKRKLFYIKDGECYHFFSNLKRGLNLYKNGLPARSKVLFESYLLDKICFCYDDIVIDCGANYADLWLCLSKLIKPTNYISFEPSPNEYRAIMLNAPEGIHNNKGLGSKNEKIKLYINEQTADSSIIEPSRWTHSIEIEEVCLESYLKCKSIKKIKLLKLEAEGAEVEVLLGCLHVLDRIAYIAVDGSPERGIEQVETFSGICNILYPQGFKMIGVDFRWSRALFVNERLG
jgi:FkbM family methyltransferase